jgi:hypothetical protein
VRNQSPEELHTLSWSKSFTCFSVDRFLDAYPLGRMSSALHTGVPELLLWWTQRIKADKNAMLSK